MNPRKYHPSEIPELEAEADRQEWEWMEGHPGASRPFDRIRMAVALMRLGCDVEDRRDGLLVDGKFIVAIHKRRWRVDGYGRWYWFSTIEKWVEKHVKGGVAA